MRSALLLVVTIIGLIISIVALIYVFNDFAANVGAKVVGNQDVTCRVEDVRYERQGQDHLATAVKIACPNQYPFEISVNGMSRDERREISKGDSRICRIKVIARHYPVDGNEDKYVRLVDSKTCWQLDARVRHF